MQKTLSNTEQSNLLQSLSTRFNKNVSRHSNLNWSKIQTKLQAHPEKLWSLNEMEKTGGEPDVIGYDEATDEYLFCDCSKESPKGRRSICYDRAAQEGRKKYPPENNALDMATAMGIEILDESQYRKLQELGDFDTKTSSWLKTPDSIRNLGGAIFGDFRYGQVFVYHNGAESYYAARGFRGILKA